MVEVGVVVVVEAALTAARRQGLRSEAAVLSRGHGADSVAPRRWK